MTDVVRVHGNGAERWATRWEVVEPATGQELMVSAPEELVGVLLGVASR